MSTTIADDGGMPTYVAFLRAINLGANRKFAKDDIRRAVESVGFTDVETHINTGNVRFTTPMRSRAKIEKVLEDAFAADRGFDVPTMVFTAAEVAELRARGELRAQLFADGVEVVRAPRLVGVVGGVVVEEDVGAEPRVLRRDGEADAPPAGDAGDEGGLAAERQ